MSTDREYLDMIKDKILSLSAEMKGEIFLFGSRSRSDFRRNSDVDIGFDKMNRDDFRKLERELSLYCEDSPIPYDIDLVFFPLADKRFRMIAEKDKIVWKKG